MKFFFLTSELFFRFATLWEHSKPELVVATASSLGASKVETCLSTLRASMDDNKRKKRAEIGILYWESDEHFCANACSVSKRVAAICRSMLGRGITDSYISLDWVRWIR